MEKNLLTIDIELVTYVQEKFASKVSNFLAFILHYIGRPYFYLLTFYFFTWRQIIEFSLLLVISEIINYALKKKIKRRRPYQKYLHIKKIINENGSSFPSCHCQNASLFSMYFVYLLDDVNYLFFFVVIYLILMIFGRVYAGLHYFSDCIAGTFIGIGISSGIIKLTEFITQPTFNNI